MNYKKLVAQFTNGDINNVVNDVVVERSERGLALIALDTKSKYPIIDVLSGSGCMFHFHGIEDRHILELDGLPPKWEVINAWGGRYTLHLLLGVRRVRSFTQFIRTATPVLGRVYK